MAKRSTTPFRNQSFFQNYGAHVNELAHQARNVRDEFGEATNVDRFKIIQTQTLKRLRMFDPFYDRFDVADEILGATILPLLIASAGLVSTSVAIWEAGHMLAIKAGIARNDGQAHGDRAVMFFLAGFALSLVSSVIFLKSAISLLSRTLATVIDGKANPVETRFNKTPYSSVFADELGSTVIDALLDGSSDLKHCSR